MVQEKISEVIRNTMKIIVLTAVEICEIMKGVVEDVKKQNEQKG